MMLKGTVSSRYQIPVNLNPFGRLKGCSPRRNVMQANTNVPLRRVSPPAKRFPLSTTISGERGDDDDYEDRDSYPPEHNSSNC